LIGIIPFAGDILDAFMAIMVLRTCQQVDGGLPSSVKAKMMFNIVLDFGIGLTPVIGDIADAIFRANTRNAIVLEKFLRNRGVKNLETAGQRPPSQDASDPEVFDRQMRLENGPPPQYSEVPSSRQGTAPSRQEIQAPLTGNGRASQRARDEVSEQQGGGGWFSGFGSKKKQQDVERGNEMLHPEPDITDHYRNKRLEKSSRS